MKRNRGTNQGSGEEPILGAQSLNDLRPRVEAQSDHGGGDGPGDDG